MSLFNGAASFISRCSWIRVSGIINKTLARARFSVYSWDLGLFRCTKRGSKFSVLRSILQRFLQSVSLLRQLCSGLCFFDAFLVTSRRAASSSLRSTRVLLEHRHANDSYIGYAINTNKENNLAARIARDLRGTIRCTISAHERCISLLVYRGLVLREGGS